MGLLYLYSRVDIILVVVLLMQVVLSTKIEILSDSDNLTVFKYYPKLITNDNYYDITTIYTIKTSTEKINSNAGFKDANFEYIYNGEYSVEVHNRTNSINVESMEKVSNVLVHSSNITLFKNTLLLKFRKNVNKWKKKEIKINGEYCDTNIQNSLLLSENVCVNVLQYISKDYQAGEALLFIEWKPQDNLNFLEISYVFRKNPSFDLMISVYDQETKELYSSVINTNVHMSTLIFKTTNIHSIYRILFSKISHIYKNDFQNFFTFGIIDIRPSNGETLYDIVGVNYLRRRPLFINESSIFNEFKNKETEIANHSNCLHGGFQIKDRPSCNCPPGFRGKFCEKACGPNLYGDDCSGVCSFHYTKACRGMYFCTTNYGCTCPAGLTGSLCNEDCPLKKYGVDCKQNCSENCFNGTCDQYTGVCSQGCRAGYMSSYCTEKYTYLLNEPKLISAEFETITIEINMTLFNINSVQSYENIKYYQLLFKEFHESEFNLSELKVFNFNETEYYTLNDLEPDTTYIIGVRLIIGDGNFNDRDIVFGQYKTSCTQSTMTNNYNVKVIEGFQSINVTWDKILSSRLECKITHYVLSVIFNHNNNNLTETYNISSSTINSYLISNIVPGYEYNIKLTPWTRMGALQTSANYNASPIFNDDDSIIVTNITATTNINKRRINVSWKFENKYLTYYINDKPITFIVKFKVNKILSCSSKEVESNWTSATVYNRTNYDILDIIPNAQYTIQVNLNGKGENNVQEENKLNILTQDSIPNLKPILNPDYPLYITNNSISIYWKINYTDCSNLNGILNKFVIELKDNDNSSSITKETKTNNITINDLKSNTSYILKIFIHNNIGYNPENFLSVNFLTKFGYLVPVDDLVAYKSSNNRMVALRWGYSENLNVDGFIILYKDISTINKTTISPIKCSDWPQFYCHLFYNLTLSNTTEFKVKAKSLNYPEGGEDKSIVYNNIEEIPENLPNNFKAIDFGKTNVTLQWDIPSKFNGVIKSFIIHTKKISSVDTQLSCNSTSIPFVDEQLTYNYTLINLIPGSMYDIDIMTESFWRSLPNKIQVKTQL